MWRFYISHKIIALLSAEVASCTIFFKVDFIFRNRCSQVNVLQWENGVTYSSADLCFLSSGWCQGCQITIKFLPCMEKGLRLMIVQFPFHSITLTAGNSRESVILCKTVVEKRAQTEVTKTYVTRLYVSTLAFCMDAPPYQLLDGMFDIFHVI